MSAPPGSNPTNNHVDAAFRDYYRCPEAFAALTSAGKLSEDCGYFRLGPDIICYGRSSSGFTAKRPTSEIYKMEKKHVADGSGLRLPVNLQEIIDNLRSERYTPNTK